MSNATPRHLATPHPLHRRWQVWAAVGVVLLVGVTTFALVQSWPGSRSTADEASPDLSAASRTEAGATTTSGPPTSSTAQAQNDGPKNLLANASFEDGSAGWRPIGAAHFTRTTEATEGAWSLRVLADPSNHGPVGITVPNVTVTERSGRYHTNAWVRPSAPGTTVTIGLREYRDGRPVPGSNTLGWTVEGADWRQFGAIHVASTSGARLTLEIMARDLPPGGWLDVDGVVLHQLPNS